MSRIIAFAILIVLAVAPALVLSQGRTSKYEPHNPPLARLHFETSLGSFKILKVDERTRTKSILRPAQGRLEMTFTGSVLIAGYEGAPIVTQGNVRKEYDRQDKQVYHGTGKIIIDGQYTAIQWFGRNLKAVWDGWGIIRLTGEFDSKGETGRYWFDGETEKQYWPAHSMDMAVPGDRVAARPRERPNRGGGQ